MSSDVYSVLKRSFRSSKRVALNSPRRSSRTLFHTIIDCPCCPEDHSISVIELADPQQWKEDPKFVKEVERIWTTNPLWYGICHGDARAVEGFWGTIYKPGDPSRKIPHFLGNTQSEVLPHMKALDPPTPQQIWGS